MDASRPEAVIAPSRPPAVAIAPGDARFLISDLCGYLESYLTHEQVREVYRAYLFGAEAHEGQSRLSGEPYIYHPVAVARILAGMRMDHQCLMAAILHDVIEDTETAKEQLAREFGPEIAELVDGVSKLAQIKFRSRAEAQAENFRKMMLAMTKDIRVILIKLADRLHNMRTLGVMGPDKARRIARETLDIYAPIANRLGINSIRHELEELGMAAHWPWRYSILRAALRKRRGNRKEVVSNIEEVLRSRLQQEGFDGEVYGREKHVYSIYRKMLEKKQPLNELADVYAFRIMVDSVDTCYRVLGVVHNLYRPVPGRFKDYIAIPKANGYQSIAHGAVRATRAADRDPDPYPRDAPRGGGRDRGALALQEHGWRWLDHGCGGRLAAQPAGGAEGFRQLDGIPRACEGRPVSRTRYTSSPRAARFSCSRRGPR